MKDARTKLTAVFDKQKELMEKYEVIEHENGFNVPSNIPVDINDKFDQHRLKDFAWRITEELAEAIEQIRFRNVKEAHGELADVLHFMAEMTILAGLEDEAIKVFEESPWSSIKVAQELKDDENYTRYYGELTYTLAMACHELKNKPWKQSHRETDEGAFTLYMKSFWRNFIYLCHETLLQADELFEEYHSKHAINKDRQKNGY